MSHKSRGAKVLKGQREKIQKGSVDMESPDMSAIEKASFMEGLQRDDGHPLHSTAVEEDLKVPERRRQSRGRKDAGPAVKPGVRQRGGAARRRSDEEEEEEEEGEKKKQTGVNVKARPEKKQQMKDAENKSQSEDESGPGAAQQRRRRVLSSEDEDLEGEDTSWKPSPKKARTLSLGQTRRSSSHTPKSRKSSSGSTSGGPGPSNKDLQKKKKQQRQKKGTHGGTHGGTQLEVVLDAFTDFCDQYRETVESRAIQQSIDSFSYNVKEQLYEKISSEKELKVLRRDNAKVSSMIRRKTQKLFDAKQELMRAERQTCLLHKDRAELKQRLSDLRRGRAFLHDLREMSRRYLEHRHTHPKERETYGSSSLAALLLETRHIQTTEQQLRGINNRLEQRLKDTETHE